MLILESDEPKIQRIKAEPLLSEVRKLEDACIDRTYCLTKCPRASTQEPHAPVSAALNKRALDLIGAYKMGARMERFSGQTRTATRRMRTP